ncbi:MAG: aminotransferase class V-fold PLP-dependent enzyme [Desulfobacterales bacterium]|nr:MAG: aminotransferase class V-fold PLP-dependent enzyme [Desulfobacterales bacterium]
MLIPKTDFIGLEGVTHLCAGGESPMLKSHRAAIEQFFADKALGEGSRHRMDETACRCKQKVGKLLGVPPDNLAFISTSSEGINLLAHGLKWRSGDNVVVCDVEFPSDVLPWTRLKEQGVEVRVVPNQNWIISLTDLERALDDRTRVVAVSDVSYFTGQRLPMKELSEMVHSTNALLSMDSTHAAGVIPVQADYADILVASCYKWLLGTHGVAIFYWNRERLPELEPPFLGWHSGESIPDWHEPTVFTLRSGADRFEAGNIGFISIYILDNALDHILRIGIAAIESHVLHLSGMVWEGLHGLAVELMTPREPSRRAGNICFMTPHINEIMAWLSERKIRVWGAYAGVGRVRVSTHVYNSTQDVERLLNAMEDLPASLKRS